MLPDVVVTGQMEELSSGHVTHEMEDLSPPSNEKSDVANTASPPAYLRNSINHNVSVSSLCTCMRVCVWLCVCTCACVRVRVYVCVRVSVSVSVYGCVQTEVQECACVRL